jgi:hypothetical protein
LKPCRKYREATGFHLRYSSLTGFA